MPLSKEEAHNKGQEDAAKGPGNYEPPARSFLDRADEIEARESYREGHSHGEAQRDKSGCFLTTACVEHAGLADDCRELTVLRSFRDNYVASLGNGSALLAEYYEVAPEIVRQIEQGTDRDTILADIFATVTKAVELIGRGNYSEAFACYEAMFAGLKKRYCSGKN
jgi:hypothetical protein